LPVLSPEAFAGDPVDTAPVDMRAYPTFDAALPAEELITQGKQLLDSGQIVAGRFALNAALARITDDGGEARAQQLRALLSDLNVPVFLGSAVLPDDPAARLVDIQTDDTFLKIASTYGLTAGLLQTLNPSLSSRDLKPHTGIKIVQGPLHARIVKHDHRLDVFARDLYITSLRVDFPEGNYLPRGDYKVSAGTKLQLGPPNSLRTWIGFHGVEDATEQVESGWVFGSAGPRGHTTRDLATGVQLSDSDMQTLFVTLTESHSHVRVEP
jgi:LysM repeat protein